MTKPKIVKSQDKSLGVIILDLSTLMDKAIFSNFNEMRKEAYEYIKEYREYFVKIVLKKHGVVYTNKMSKRQIRELFDEKIVGIIKDEKNNYDKIYKEGNLIGYWNRNIELTFRKGRLLCRIEYRIF